MGGSGGGGYVPSGSMDKLLADAHKKTDAAAYNSAVNVMLQDALRQYNDRDVVAIKGHLEEICDLLGAENDYRLDMVFGGSVQRHTYVDGLSDIDALIKLKGGDLADKTPGEVLTAFAGQLSKLLPDAKVYKGNLAVTVEFRDGHVIQVLPAVETKSGYRIASQDGEKWSSVIRPDSFAKKLTDVNQANAGKVIPAIKLFKAVQSNLPEDVRLTGYHAESIAIKAFEGYSGGKSNKDMLQHLCSVASKAVLSPIQDKTGQSVHVDEYLGAANSAARQKSAGFIGRLAIRLAKNDSTANVGDWKKLLE